MNEQEEKIIMWRLLELIILRHQVRIVDDFNRECFGFVIVDNCGIINNYDIIVRDIESVLPEEYVICGKIIDSESACVGLYKEK